MKKRKRWIIIFLAAFLFLAVSNVFAGEPGYTLDWWTVDGGGGAIGDDAGFSLNSTIGQFDAAVLGDG
ncbi:MAG: hypothetical protein JXA42_09265, partial [Anaerolineales bacterium]|nr:hypothetical protein [Anaerolineales bacterium]